MDSYISKELHRILGTNTQLSLSVFNGVFFMTKYLGDALPPKVIAEGINLEQLVMSYHNKQKKEAMVIQLRGDRDGD